MRRLIHLILFVIVGLLTANVLFAQKLSPSAASSRRTLTRSHRSHSVAARSHSKAARGRPLRTATARPLLPQPQGLLQPYAIQTNVNLAPSSPLFTAIDPFANGLTPSNPLKPDRPFWYSVDKNGLTIVGLRTETTGALMVGGPPINVVANQVVGYVPWPDAIPITQTDGEVPTDPTVAADHNKFAWRDTVGGWEPVGITVSYPTDEALASNSETPPTFVYVVMKHSGYEWQSETNLPNGRDPNLRDKIVPATSLATESSLLVQVDVSQPDYPVDLFPTGPPIGSGLLGHNAGQPTFDPASDSVYVGNMPSTSLPTTPQVPNDLTSFVSVLTLAPGELPAPGEVPAPVTVTVLCGPEHPDIALLGGFPEAWACIAEGGEGPFTWTFTNLPSWLTAHIDPVTGQGDGILYGTPPLPLGPLGSTQSWTFQAHVDDNATVPPGTGDATITLLVSNDPASEYENGELEWEVGVPAAVAIEGTPKPGTTGNPCELAPTLSPGSLVPSWVDMVQIPGRTINNTAVGGPVENTIGCVLMGTPPVSGEYYEFQMPNFQFVWPTQNLPIIISGQVLGPYTFDPLPKDVGLSGLAWHQIDKIHDPSTEADLLNREFFGVEPYTGQIYRIVAPYAGLEAEGTVVPPPALQGELDEISPYADALTPLITARSEIAAALTTYPSLKVRFGNLAVEANPNPNVYVTAPEIADPAGIDPMVIPIGGPIESAIPIGALIKVSGTRDINDPAVATMSAISPIDVPGVQAYFLGLDSNLAPAALETGEPGQTDNGALFVTGTNTGNVSVVDTMLGMYAQMLAVPNAGSLGGVSVDPTTRLAYVAGISLQNVTILGQGTPPQTAPTFWSASSATFTVGTAGSFALIATGWPTPILSMQGTLPNGVAFTPNTNGTATLAGIPTLEGNYPLTITAANGLLPDATQNFILTVNPAIAPAITTQPTSQTVTAPQAATFTSTASGSPSPTVQWELSTDSGVTWSSIAGATSTSYTTGATTTVMNGYQYRAVFTNSAGTATSDAATLTVNEPSPAPAITTQPTSQTVTALQTATFTSTASGSPSPTVQWELSTDSGVTWSIIAGATTTTYTTVPTTMAMSGYQFRAVFTNNVGTATSNAATLTVNEVTAPAITKAFGTASLNLGGSTSLSFTITNSNTSVALAGVAFTDNLPGGLAISTPNGLTGTCAGSITAAAGSSSVALSGGSIAASSNCTFSVNVIATAAGNQVNTTGAVTSTNGGTGNTATASINVLAPDLTITKSHTGNFFQGQTGATYSVTVSNAGPGQTAGAVTVTEVVPAGLTVTALTGSGWTCTVATVSCNRSDPLAAAASYPAITTTVSVAASAPATVTSSASVSGGGEVNVANNVANDLTNITAPPDFAIEFATTATITVRAGQQASYVVKVSPVNNAFANAINLTASGLPPNSQFTFTPSAVTPGPNPVTSTLTVITTGPSLAKNTAMNRGPLYAMLLPFSALLLSGLALRKRGWREGKAGWALVAFMLLSCGIVLNGCATGSGKGNSLVTPAGTYTITITATSGTTQHSAPVTLIVQP